MNGRTSLPFVVALAGCAGAEPATAISTTTPSPAPAPAVAAPVAADGCAAPDVPATPDAAAVVTDRVDGCFEPGGEHDLYRLVVPGEGRQRVTLAITGAPENVSTFVKVLGPSGERLRGSTAAMATRGTATRAEVIAEAGTVLHLEAYPNVDPVAPQPWSIAIAAEPIAGEPDDEPRPLALDTPHAAAIEPWVAPSGEHRNDEDRYVVEVATAGTLTARVDDPQNGLRPMITILDAAGDRKGKSRVASHTQDSNEATAQVTPGRYTIVIHDAGASGTALSNDDQPSVVRGYTLTATVSGSR